LCQRISELNELTNFYNNREDIVFISLAYDKEEVKRVLLKKLNYNNVKVLGIYWDIKIHTLSAIVIDEKKY
jgi:hypothetical protein